MNDWVSYKGDILTKPIDVEGYEKLSIQNKKLLEAFLKNYYKVWEYPEDHLPIKVRFVGKENYLRVDFTDGGWLHVKNANTWY